MAKYKEGDEPKFKVGDKLRHVKDNIYQEWMKKGLITVSDIEPNTETDEKDPFLYGFKEDPKDKKADWYNIEQNFELVEPAKKKTKKETKMVEKTDLPESLSGGLQSDGFRLDESEKEMFKKYKAGISHMFIFYFNINDYVRAGEKFVARREYLAESFSQRKFVIFYNISSGIEFAKGTEKAFREKTGFKEQKKSPLASVMGAQAIGLPKNGSSALPLLENFLKKEKDSVVVIEYAEKLCPAENGSSASQEDRVNTVTLSRWAQDPQIMENNNMIILLTTALASLHSDLRTQDSGIEAISVPKPDVEEREKYINYLGVEYSEEIKGLDIPQISYITAGLSRKQIEDVFLQARQEKISLSLNSIKKKKEEILNQEYGDVLKVMNPQHGMETIGGLEKIKKVLAKIVEALKTGNYRRAPMGVALFGPPGTAKTVTGEAVAKEAEFNFLQLGNIRHMYVGSSEQRWEKAKMGIISSIPAVVFVDEISQAFDRQGDISTDSGVNRKLLGKILEFMSDTTFRGKVLWIGASNRPDLIDTAMKRPGRFDLKIPFLFPQGTEELAKIFKAILIKYKIRSKFKDFVRLAAELEEKEIDYNGADIEAIVLTAFNHAQDNGREELILKDYEYGIWDYIPSRDQDMVDSMTLNAIKECSSRSLYPENVEEILRKIKKRRNGESTETQKPSYQRKVRNQN